MILFNRAAAGAGLPPVRFTLSTLALALAPALAPALALFGAMLALPASVHAQQSSPAQATPAWLNAPIALKSTPRLAETIPPAQRGQLPSFISGDRISGQPDLALSVQGQAKLRRGDTAITADRLDYNQSEDIARATGNVRVNQAGNVYEGPELQLKLESFEGFFNRVHYEILATGGQGDAERIDFVDANLSVARQATYTTCRREDYPGWVPAWILSTTQLTTDTETNVGVAKNAQVKVFGISTPAFPSISFPLSSARKSGFLAPTIGLDSVNGIEFTQPYYWNIAPNRDATITPTLMGKRGVNVSTDFRYLEEKYNGEARVDVMPTDTLRNRARWGIWSQHNQTFDAKALGLDSLTGRLGINRVSDDDYWRDFQRTPSLTGRLLPSEGAVNWVKGGWSGGVRLQSWQTLRYDPSPIIPPYDRLPQITANYDKYDWHGFDFSLINDLTRFHADPLIQRQPNGERAFTQAQLSRPFLTPGTFVIPKVQLHAAAYHFDSALANGDNSANRVIPTVSLDSGLIFERDANLFGRALRQTLEPRAFYVYTPYRDQSRLPNYDSAANDFNFATVYTENEFSGHDRISATNAVTLGVTTRFLDKDTGAEAARFGIAQRYRFSDQNVTLPTAGATSATLPANKGVSDLLLGAQVNWTPKWSVDTTIQYNPDTKKSVRNTIGARYSPSSYRTVSAAYRYQDDSVAGPANGGRSIDLGWQWPLNDLWGDKGKDLGSGRGQGSNRWYAVGRLNYSLRDKRATDAVIGFEYDGCCYIGRVVLEQLSTGQASVTRRIMFQLELIGFSSVGTSPLRTLQLNVPRYQPLRSPTEPPSRYTNYD